MQTPNTAYNSTAENIVRTDMKRRSVREEKKKKQQQFHYFVEDPVLDDDDGMKQKEILTELKSSISSWANVSLTFLLTF